MSTVSATEARRRLYSLIDEVGQSHQPVQIHGKRGNAVLLSEDDWRSIQETFHLLAIPGMRESILEGMATEASALTPEPGWSAGPFSLQNRPRSMPANSPPRRLLSSRRPRPYKALMGDLRGSCSRRINIQHRLDTTTRGDWSDSVRGFVMGYPRD